MIRKAAICVYLLQQWPQLLRAQERDVPKGIPHLDHAFVIVMENHGYQQILNNPNEPYLNSLIVNKEVISRRTISLWGIPV